MVSPESPLSPRFWRDGIDSRRAALLRIGLGLLVLIDLADRSRDLYAFYSENGVVPASSMYPMSHWATIARHVSLPLMFSVGALLACLLVLGWRTRVVSVLTFLFVVTLQGRNYLVLNGADDVLRVLLLWGCFMDWGAAFSLDARRRGLTATVPAIPYRVAQLQIAAVYLVTALVKLHGRWLDGSALHFALRAAGFVRPSAALLYDLPSLCIVLTAITPMIELMFPFLVFSPVANRTCRVIALTMGIGLHLSIAALMRVGLFSLTMLISYLLFVPTDSLTPRPLNDARPLGWRWLYLVLVVHCVVAATIAHIRSEAWPLADLRTYFHDVGLGQSWRMFQSPPTDIATWRAVGLRSDGVVVDLLPMTTPELVRDVAWVHSRWTKYRGSLRNAPDRLPGFGAFLCRRYRSEHPEAPLLRFDLYLTTQPIVGPGQGAEAPETNLMLSQPCRLNPPALAPVRSLPPPSE